MQPERITIGGIPALVWGPASDRVWLCVHGKMSCKEAAEGIAQIAAARGCQTISFDLPQHGERAGQPDRCDIWHGIRDLTTIGDHVFARWQDVSLYACSLGAFFSLHAYGDRPLRKCLFQSPIVDMPWLVGQMMRWFGITPEQLAREREIDTPVDLLSWDYYQYVLAHPITRWDAPTSILYGGRDTLQSPEVMQAFADRFHAAITLSPGSEHPFMQPEDGPIVSRWLHDGI